MKIEINGLNINYETFGEGQDVLFLHGWGANLQSFTRITNEVSKKYRVTAIDYPGCGESEIMTEPWEVENYAQMVLELIEKLGLKNPILVGHSFGGRIIIKLCGTNRLNPEKIVMLDAAGIKPKKSFSTRIKQRSFKIAKGFCKFPLWKKWGEEQTEKMRKIFGSADYNAAPLVLRQTLVKTVNEDLTRLLKNISASTLLIFGENDDATPLRDAHIMEREIPDAGLCVIKDAGHWAMVEKPFEVIAIIKSFLEIE